MNKSNRKRTLMVLFLCLIAVISMQSSSYAKTILAEPVPRMESGTSFQDGSGFGVNGGEIIETEDDREGVPVKIVSSERDLKETKDVKKISSDDPESSEKEKRVSVKVLSDDDVKTDAYNKEGTQSKLRQETKPDDQENKIPVKILSSKDAGSEGETETESTAHTSTAETETKDTYNSDEPEADLESETPGLEEASTSFSNEEETESESKEGRETLYDRLIAGTDLESQSGNFIIIAPVKAADSTQEDQPPGDVPGDIPGDVPGEEPSDTPADELLDEPAEDPSLSEDPSPEDPFVSDPIASDANSSGNLADFLDWIEFRDEEGNVLSAKDIVPGGKYTIVLHFKEPATRDKVMRPATEQEMLDAGIPQEDLEDGEWMYLELGDDVQAFLDENGGLSDDVRIVDDGHGLLVRFKYPDGYHPMDECEVSIPVELNENADIGSLDIVVGSEKGQYTPPGYGEPFLSKKTGTYDPNTHRIKYTVTVTNPTDEPMNGFTFEDVSSAQESAGVYPKLAEGTLTANGQSYPDVVSDENGKFTFTYEGTIDPKSSIDITYELDVSDLLSALSETSGMFLVDNLASCTPLEEKFQPFSDDAQFEVDMGYLKKNGYIRCKEGELNFYGHDCVMDWEIEAYDPYQPLDQFQLGDYITQNGETVKNPNVLAVFFYAGDQTYFFIKGHEVSGNYLDFTLLESFMTIDENGNITFDFSLAPPDIREKLFSDDGKHLKMSVLTEYEHGEEGYGYYINTAKGKLPSEVEERDADAHVNVGDPGVSCYKTGTLSFDGKKLHYTVTMKVDAHISDSDNPAYKIGAGLIDGLNVKDDTFTETTGRLDVMDAIDVQTVKATYQKDGQEQSYVFTRDDTATSGNSPYTFGVYPATQFTVNGTVYLGIVHTHEGDGHLAIVLNPTVVPGTEPSNPLHQWNADQVYGSWPDELNDYDVNLTFEYEIDPTKAFFVNDVTHKKEDYQGCETLHDYLSCKGDILVNNSVIGGVKSSSGNDWTSVDMTIPLTKKADVHIDLANDQKIVSYTVTFENGEDNNAAIPQGTSGLVFRDRFDDRMNYIENSLQAALYVSGALQSRYRYAGQTSPNSGNELTASWTDFQNGSNETLQEVFNAQTGHYNITFTYDLTPSERMPMEEAVTEVRNESWVEYAGTETDHAGVSVDLPTGALTKQAALENGKVAFYIEINEGCVKMSPAGGKLSIIDEFGDSQYLTLNEDEITVEEYQNGIWTALAESAEVDGFEKVTENGKLTLKVPDEKHLRVRYSYSLTDAGKEQHDVGITNNVRIEGKDTLTDGDSWQFLVSEVQASASSSAATLLVKKIRQGTEEPIPGTRFTLYAHNPGDLDTSAADEEAGKIDLPLLSDTSYGTLRPVEVYTTKNDGTAEVNWILMKTNTVYALVESYVPDGYTRLETPIYFRVSNGIAELPENESELVSAEGNTVTVENILKEASTGGLSVTKTVTGAYGDQEKEWKFRVELSDTSVSGSFGDMTFRDGVTEFFLKHGETKTADGLPSGITYTVSEDEANKFGYTTAAEADTGTIPDGDTAAAQFTNDCNKDGLYLPETGGPGVLPLIACFFLLCFVGFWTMTLMIDRRR